MYKNINGKRIKMTKQEMENFLKNQNVRDLEAEKEAKIRVAKGMCQDYIYSKYSLTDQLNIQNLFLNYTEEDLNEMKYFIENEIKSCREMVEKIKEAKNIEELDKIEVVKNG